MNIQFKKWISFCSSMCMALLLCLSVPMSYASDRDIYTTATAGNITLMLVLDQSASMEGTAACDLPQGFVLYRYNSAASGTYAAANFDNKYATKHSGITYNFKQNFCTAYPIQIKYKRYYASNGDYKYLKCVNKASRYENCIWDTVELSSQPTGTDSAYTGIFYLNGTGVPPNRRNITVYYSLITSPAPTSTSEKFYTRIPRIQNAIYELMYGPNAIDDEKSIGVAVFPYAQLDPTTGDVTLTETSKGSIQLPARKLNSDVSVLTSPKVNTSLTTAKQRYAVMRAAAQMKATGTTPLLNVYADVASYLLGTNTIRKPLQKLKYVQRIAWKECEYHKADNRTADGSCKDWYPSGSNANDSYNWDRSDLPYTHFDANSLVELDIAACTKNTTTPAQLTGISACYGVRRILPRYASALPVDETDETKRVWRTCTKWDEDGKCQTDALDWHTSDTATTTTWNSTKPNDPRLDDSSPNRYGKISIDEYRCPSSGGSVSENTHNLTCYGDEIDVPVFAVKRITTAQTPATSNIVWGANGVWKTCNTNQTDGTCSTADYVPNGVNLTATGWSNVAPASTDLENTEASFCSNVTQLEIPGNNTGYAGICYYADDSSIYAPMTDYQYYSGFLRSVRASKVNANAVKSPATNTDTVANLNDLQNTYDPPASIKAQINDSASRQCGGQAIYMLTDGQQNSSGLTISRRLYRSALTSDSTPSLTAVAKTFNCRSATFGGTNTVWSCAANFSRYLLDAAVTPIRSSIKTATVGFGAEYEQVPKYNNDLSASENAAIIQDAGLPYNVSNFALLGINGQGGWYRGNSTEDVVNSIKNVLDKISSTAIPALNTGTVNIPLDALNPTQIQEYAYYPEFQPRPDISYPLWFGNLKKFGVYKGILVEKIPNSNTETATSVLDNFGNVKTNLSDLWKGTDAIGGALGKIPLRTTESRKLLINQTKITTNGVESYEATTHSSEGDDGLTQISKDYINSTDSNRGYLLTLLGYSIGQDKVDSPSQLGTDPAALDVNPVLRQMGAAMHSTPILLTQSGSVRIDPETFVTTTENPTAYVAFGTQQGLLQVVDAKTGIEKFAFVPQEMVQKQKKGFLDSSLVTGATGIYHGIDGAWTAHTEYVPKVDSINKGMLTVGTGTNNQKGKQWIYGGLRMGGRSYYALDLSDIDKPKLKFYINPNADSNLVTVDNVVSRDSLGQPLTTPKTDKPISYMGQSWSTPTLTYVNWKGKRKLVMLVGGGYDMGYEADNYEQSNGIGAGVYMFDADNGDLLWWSSSNPTASTNTGLKDNALKAANMKYSVVGRINTLDRNNDGLTDHLYFADLGGQLWRVDIDNKVTGDDSQFATRATRLLNLHAAANDGTSPRFYEAPNVSVYSEPGVGRFVAVTLGSGNRSQPLSQYTSDTKGNRINDALYTVFDKDVGKTGLYKNDYPITTQNLVLSDLTANADKVGTAIPYSSKGWYYSFSSQYVQSAKVMGELVSINKNLYVPVYDASKDGTAGSCGTGVKGVTIVHRLCLPYGKCGAGESGESNELYLGSGLLGVNIGSGSESSSIQVIGGVCEGTKCKKIGGNTEDISLVKKSHSIVRNLFPIRWYEQIAKD